MDINALSAALASQYQAALRMLREAITAAPERVWDDPAYGNQTWRLAYHTLFCTQMYLGPSEEAEVPPWEHAIKDAGYLVRWEPPYDVPVVEGSNTPEQLAAYIDSITNEIPEKVARLPLGGESGFSWLPFSRFELHLYNIRHIQHHTGQIIERLRAHGVDGIAWVFQGEM